MVISDGHKQGKSNQGKYMKQKIIEKSLKTLVCLQNQNSFQNLLFKILKINLTYSVELTKKQSVFFKLSKHYIQLYIVLHLECGTFHPGKPNVQILEDPKPHEVVEMVITDEILDNCIIATNSHGQEDAEFTKIFPNGISDGQKGGALIKGYLAIEWHLSLFVKGSLISIYYNNFYFRFINF